MYLPECLNSLGASYVLESVALVADNEPQTADLIKLHRVLAKHLHTMQINDTQDVRIPKYDQNTRLSFCVTFLE